MNVAIVTKEQYEEEKSYYQKDFQQLAKSTEPRN
jgi:hypothetical protein